MRKKILITVLFAIIFIGFITTVKAENENYTKQNEYLEQNYKMAQLSTDLQNKLMDYYNIKSQYIDTYPEYFGGIYISDDAQSLILQIVEKNIPEKDTDDYKIYNEITTMDDAIKIEYVNYSFNELNAANNAIGDSVEKMESINSAYIDVMNNSVTVGVSENNESNRKIVKNYLLKTRSIIDSNIVNFIQAEAEQPYADINAGGKIYLTSANDDKYACSMGFRTRLYGMDGYVTAGHCVKDYPTPPSGIVMYTNFIEGGYYDYAFVATNDRYTPTNKLNVYLPGFNNTLGVYNYSINVTVNMNISKIGFKTGLTTGKVTGLNKTVTYELSDGSSFVIKGLVNSNLVGNKGDSGGIVFIPKTNQAAIPIGVVNAGKPGKPDMSFTNISDMLGDLQTGRY